VNSTKSVAFIGTAGVPNTYGGFEGFLEVTVPIFVEHGYAVSVTCDSARHSEKSQLWRGAKRKFIGIPANGGLSVLHDFIAFFRVFRSSRNIVILGVSAGVFFPFFRLMCDLARKRLIVNVDGVEWRRKKFSFPKRLYLWFSDFFAQSFAHFVIIDNEGLRPFLTSVGKIKAVFIPYSGDHVIRIPSLVASSEPYLLSICRIEPENNCDLLLNAFRKLRQGKYVFIGNWGASDYGKVLQKEYKGTPGLVMHNAIYDQKFLASLRESCSGYVHGHSVGGTNPSLVEMLFYDCRIAAFDCVFNRNTSGADAEYFRAESDLVELMSKYLSSPASIVKKSRNRYTAHAVVSEYEALLL
jgi:glycosyltransferase involved in cell wall biosynthesis